MLFRQNYCRKSQKGVYLHRVKSQKGVDMKDQKSQKGADGIIMKRKIYQQLLRKGLNVWQTSSSIRQTSFQKTSRR